MSDPRFELALSDCNWTDFDGSLVGSPSDAPAMCCVVGTLLDLLGRLEFPLSEAARN
jgi:hypothetical protein